MAPAREAVMHRFEGFADLGDKLECGPVAHHAARSTSARRIRQPVGHRPALQMRHATKPPIPPKRQSHAPQIRRAAAASLWSVRRDWQIDFAFPVGDVQKVFSARLSQISAKACHAVILSHATNHGPVADAVKPFAPLRTRLGVSHNVSHCPGVGHTPENTDAFRFGRLCRPI